MRYLVPLFLVVAAASCDRTKDADQSARVDTMSVADSSPAPVAKLAPPPPIRQMIVDTSREIRQQSFAAIPFEIPAGRALCGLDGKVQVISGGMKDVEVYVLSDARYQEWQQSASSEPTAPRETEWISSAAASGDYAPGRYYLVVSNRFSLGTPKAVTIEASYYCP